MEVLSGPTISVLIVDDDALVRSALRRVLEGAPGVRIAGEASDGDEVVDRVATTRPDVVLMDLRMPRVDGLSATERLHRLPGGPAVLVLTTFHADEQVLRALRAGAAGFLLKDTPPERIVEAIRTVAAGESALSPAVARQLVAHVADDEAVARRDHAQARLRRLTNREREVAAAIGRGQSNAEIGAALALSIATVKAHVTRLFAKLEVDNRVQVALLVHDAERR